MSLSQRLSSLAQFLAGLLVLLALVPAPLPAQTDVQGTIGTDSTWTTADSPIVVRDDITIASGVTLTVEAGVVIKFEYVGDVDDTHRFIVSGDLQTKGTTSDPVVFTSLRDDTVGGDTNDDGTTTTPSPGDWGYIRFTGQSTTDSLAHTKIRYGGRRDDDSIDDNCCQRDLNNYMVWVNTDIVLEDNVFEDAQNVALRIAATDAQNVGTSPIDVPVRNNVVRSSPIGVQLLDAGGPVEKNTIEDAGNTALYVRTVNASLRDNTIRRAGDGIVVDGGADERAAPPIENNTIREVSGYPLAQVDRAFPTYAGNTIEQSERSAVRVSGRIAPAASATERWTTLTNAAGDTLEYVLTDDLVVGSETTLEVPAGQIVKFQVIGDVDDTHRLIVDGHLQTEGTSSSPVVFTSLRDDTYGGDTNTDGTGSTPSSGDWGYIRFTPQSSTDSLTHTIVRYGGRRDDDDIDDNCCQRDLNNYMVWVQNDLVVADNSLENARATALRVEANDGQNVGSSPIDVPVRRNVVQSSPTGIELIDAGGPVENNMVRGAGNVGIRVVEVSATITGNTIRRGGDGIDVDGGAAERTAPVIENNTISEVGSYPIAQIDRAFPTYSGNTIRKSGVSGIRIGGRIAPSASATERWTTVTNADGDTLEYVLAGDLRLGTDATLEVPAGQVVKFEYVGDVDDTYRVIVNGDLQTEGTASKPVVFTSLRDDAYGGDTSNDNTSTSPSPGDWGYLRFTPQSSTDSLTNTVVRYGGRRDDDSIDDNCCQRDLNNYMVWVQNDLVVADNMFENAKQTALRVQSSDAQNVGTSPIDVPVRRNVVRASPRGIELIDAGGPVEHNTVEDAENVGIRIVEVNATIAGNTIRRGGNGININGGTSERTAPTLTNNTIREVGGFALGQVDRAFPSYSGNTIRGSELPAIRVSGRIAPSASATERWTTVTNADGDTLEYVLDGDLIVGTEATLEIPAGQVVKVSRRGDVDNTLRIIVNGHLEPLGSAPNPVVFTSLRDDSYGGDTNGDGTATTPSRGDWGYLRLTAQTTTDTLAHTVVRYGGRRDDDNIDDDCCQRNLHNYLVWVESPVTLYRSTIEESAGTGIRADVASTTQPTVHRNNIVNHGGDGLVNAQSDTLDATNNWWGAESGPTSDRNSDGTGESVSGAVAFDPFLTAPIQSSLSVPSNVTARTGDELVRLSWGAVSDPDPVSYRIYRDTAATPTTPLATVPAASRTYDDTTVANDTAYYYRVTAVYDDGVESSFSNEVRATPAPPPIYGDVTGDSTVTAFDGSRILQHVAGITTPDLLPLTGPDSASAEVTANGAISALDASLVFQRAAGLITCFPVEGQCAKSPPADVSRPKTIASGTAPSDGGSIALGPARSTANGMALPVRVTGDSRPLAVELTLTHDPSVLRLNRIESSLPNSWQVSRQTGSGTVRLALAGAQPLSEGRIVRLHYERTRPDRTTLQGTAVVNEAESQSLAPVTVGQHPDRVALKPSRPNPFSDRTEIVYALPRSQQVSLAVYDVLGRRVATLVDEQMRPGRHRVQWNGTSETGERLSSGTYFTVLETKNARKVRRLVLVR